MIKIQITSYLFLFHAKLGTKKNPREFGWTQRYKVATGVAEALEYLHCKDDHPVIHRDVKSSNVLLSEDFEPQVFIYLPIDWLLIFRIICINQSLCWSALILFSSLILDWLRGHQLHHLI